MAANVEIDEAALAAAHAGVSEIAVEPEIPESVEDIFAEIDPRCARGGKSYQFFPRFETEEEFQAWRDSRPDRESWIDEDGRPNAQIVMSMAPGEPGARTPRGSSSESKRPQKKPVKPVKEYKVKEGESASPLVRAHVRGLTHGVREFYGRNPGLACSIAKQIAQKIATKQVPLIPRRKRSKVKNKSIGIEIYGLNEADATQLRRRPGSLAQELTKFAYEQDGARIHRRDNDEVTGNPCEEKDSVVHSFAEGET
jgi:hypothetical protein